MGNESLTSLDLNNNGIGAAGAGQIADALRNNTTLTSLSLFANGIGAAGVAALVQAIVERAKVKPELAVLKTHVLEIDEKVERLMAQHHKEAITVFQKHAGREMVVPSPQEQPQEQDKRGGSPGVCVIP